MSIRIVRFFLLVTCLLVTLGCLGSSAAKSPTATALPQSPPTQAGSDMSPAPAPAPTRARLFNFKRPTRAPANTPSAGEQATVVPTGSVHSATSDRIEVDYLYTRQMITAIYHLYGSILDDYLEVSVRNTNAGPVKVVVESEIVGYTTKAIDTVTLAPGEKAEIVQNPRLTSEAIDQLNAMKPADFHIRVLYLEDGQERELLDQTHETLVYSRRDFPWSVSGFSQDEVFELIAALSTPHDPAVEELLRAAADYNPSGIMTSGYGGVENDEEGKVWNRLEAIYRAEAETYGLTYISTWVSYAPGDVQRIRLPAEVLEQRSGNCIELALLFAAAAEALDLEPAILLIPGHAYVAVRTDMTHANYYFIESTMVGRNSFAEAIAAGNAEWEDTQPHLDAGEENYGWVTLSLAREKGILPIPWR